MSPSSREKKPCRIDETSMEKDEGVEARR